MIGEQVRDNGRRELQSGTRPDFEEIGTGGLGAWGGYIQEAYLSELTWPAAYDEYNRMWRSTPAITITRGFFDVLVSQIDIQFERDTDTPADRRAENFGNSVLAGIEGGIGAWLKMCVDYVPFFGFGWWGEVPAIRKTGWRPPDFADGEPDPWRSQSNDGLIGIRRLAFRHPSSFWKWDISDATGRLRGMVQLDYPNDEVTIPLDRSAHIRFGDMHNPEGYTPLEAMYKLERMWVGYTMIHAIGSEHSAGYLSVHVEDELSATDHANIKRAARNIMTAQEGNYAAWPGNIKSADLIDVPFRAAGDILEAQRYYYLLMLQLYMMQWVAMSTTAGTGSYSAMQDASLMAVNNFNAMVKGFVESQLDDQLGRRLFHDYNPRAFPGLEERPHLTVSEIEKEVALNDLGQFAQVMALLGALTEEDIAAVKRTSRILPEPTEDKIAMPAIQPDEQQPADGGDLAKFQVAMLQQGQTLQEKIETMPDWAQQSIGETQEEFERLRELSFVRRTDRLEGTPDADWDEAVAADLAAEEGL